MWEGNGRGWASSAAFQAKKETRLGVTNNAEQNVQEMLDAVDLNQNGRSALIE
jgi:hypothetical protein